MGKRTLQHLSFSHSFSILLSIVITLITGSAFAEEQIKVKELHEEHSLIKQVTGFRSCFDDKSGLDCRLIEFDGSATVAMNPVRLILVCSFDDPDKAAKMFELPAVSSIKSFRYNERLQRLELECANDVMDDQGTIQQSPVVLRFIDVKSLADKHKEDPAEK